MSSQNWQFLNPSPPPPPFLLDIYQDDIVYGQLHMLCPENFDIKVRCSQIKIDLKAFKFLIATSKKLRPHLERRAAAKFSVNN